MVCVVKPHHIGPETCGPAGVKIMMDPLTGPRDTEQACFLDPEVQKTGFLGMRGTRRDDRLAYDQENGCND
jgi:hypothetical protein